MKTAKIITICLYWIFLFPCLSLALQESDLSPLYELLEKKGFYTIGNFQGANKTLLSYGKFGRERGKNGSLLFINGKEESLFRYLELFYDFYLQGWSPIYTYDHRNQGFSKPISIETESFLDFQSSYSENYSLYREDLKAFIRFVLDDSEMDRANLFLIAHSKGGAIVLDYLQTYPESVFKSVALSSPMIKYRSHFFSFLETGVIFVLGGFCSLLPCNWKIPSLRSEWTYKTFTDSKERYLFSKFVEKNKFPQSASTGTSFNWLLESFKVTDKLMDEDRIQRIKTPIMILQAEKDYFVLNKYHNLFCEKIPNCCHIEKVSGKHELFMETDKIRNPAVKKTMRFFLDSEKEQKKCQI